MHRKVAGYARGVVNNTPLFRTYFYKKYNQLQRYKHLNKSEIDSWSKEFEDNDAKWHKVCRLKFSDLNK